MLGRPEIHLGDEVLVLDLAGWRHEHLPEVPDVPWMSLAPDWLNDRGDVGRSRRGASAGNPTQHHRPVRYVVDSSIAIAALNGMAAVKNHLEAVSGDDVGIPMVALGELLFGAQKSKRRTENLKRIAALRRSIATLPLTDGVIERYGETRARLEARGIVKSDFGLRAENWLT